MIIYFILMIGFAIRLFCIAILDGWIRDAYGLPLGKFISKKTITVMTLPLIGSYVLGRIFLIYMKAGKDEE